MFTICSLLIFFFKYSEFKNYRTSIIVSICEAVLKIAKDRYSGDFNASSIPVNNVEIVDRVLRFVEDLVNNSNTDFESSIALEFDYDCDIDTYVEGYDLISDTINEFHEDSEDEEDVEEASASLSQRVSQKWEEEDVDGVNFTYQELVNIHISSRHIEDNACEFVQMVNEKRAQINP